MGYWGAFSMIYGDANVVTVIWTVWKLEEMAERSGIPLKVKKIPGANHFVSIMVII